MALAFFVQTAGFMQVTGLAADTKPTAPGPNWTFLEIDTNKFYRVVAAEWTEVPAAGAAWGGITGTLSTQSDLQTALNGKAPLASPTFTGTVTVPGLTIANATDIIINATTGTKIGQATSKIGFFGLTPVVRPTAITQTYATASATHANVTQLAAPAGGTGATAGAYSTAANRDLMIASVNAARADIANVKQVLNTVIDQLQALGLLQ